MAGGKFSFKTKNIFLQNTQLLNFNQHTCSKLPRYIYVVNTTLYSLEPTINDHTIVNSGATNTFIVVNTKLKHKTPNLHYLPVTLLNGECMYTTLICKLDIPELPLKACLVHVLPCLYQYILIYVKQLCDTGYILLFDTTTATFLQQEVNINRSTRF